MKNFKVASMNTLFSRCLGGVCSGREIRLKQRNAWLHVSSFLIRLIRQKKAPQMRSLLLFSIFFFHFIEYTIDALFEHFHAASASLEVTKLSIFIKDVVSRDILVFECVI